MEQSSAALSAEFWEQRYREGTDRWNLGQPAPPFVRWLGGDRAPTPGRALVLGCGPGHEAVLFARHGFQVTAVDFAPFAIATTAELARHQNQTLELRQQDIFTLLPELTGQFDYVVEHTCFCAIDPARRGDYVDLVAGLLRPQGQLLGLFFTHGRPGGPPFGVTTAELHRLFSPQFQLLALVPATHSVPSRQGEEHVGHFQAHSSQPESV